MFGILLHKHFPVPHFKVGKVKSGRNRAADQGILSLSRKFRTKPAPRRNNSLIRFICRTTGTQSYRFVFATGCQHMNRESCPAIKMPHLIRCYAVQRGYIIFSEQKINCRAERPLPPEAFRKSLLRHCLGAAIGFTIPPPFGVPDQVQLFNQGFNTAPPILSAGDNIPRLRCTVIHDFGPPAFQLRMDLLNLALQCIA